MSGFSNLFTTSTSSTTFYPNPSIFFHFFYTAMLRKILL